MINEFNGSLSSDINKIQSWLLCSKMMAVLGDTIIFKH